METLTANGAAAANHGPAHLIRVPERPAEHRAQNAARAGRSTANEVRADFFKDLRAGVDLDALEDSDLPALRPRARRTLSQPRCAARMNISEKHLRNLENGAPWTKDLVWRYEKAIGLSGRSDPEAVEQRIALWEVALARRPPGPLSALSPADRLRVARQREPTFICGDDWDLLLCNAVCVRWFPEWAEPGINILDYVLGAIGEANMPDWRECWVEPMLAQVRLTLASAGTHDLELYQRLEDRLAQLRERSPVVDRAWRKKQFRPGPNGGVRAITVPIYQRSGGDERVVGREVLRIMLSTGVVPGTANTRITTLFPEPWDFDDSEVVDHFHPIASDA